MFKYPHSNLVPSSDNSARWGLSSGTWPAIGNCSRANERQISNVHARDCVVVARAAASFGFQRSVSACRCVSVHLSIYLALPPPIPPSRKVKANALDLAARRCLDAAKAVSKSERGKKTKSRKREESLAPLTTFVSRVSFQVRRRGRRRPAAAGPGCSFPWGGSTVFSGKATTRSVSAPVRRSISPP